MGKQLSGADKQKRMLSNVIRVSTWPEKQPNSPFVSQLSPKPCFRTLAFQILHSCDGLVNIHPQSDFPYVSKPQTGLFPAFLSLFSQELLTSTITELHFPSFSPFQLNCSFSFPLQMTRGTQHLQAVIPNLFQRFCFQLQVAATQPDSRDTQHSTGLQ